MKIAVIYGSVRSERQGIRAARFVVRMLEERDHAVTLIDPKKYELPLLDKMHKEFDAGTAPKAMETVSRILDEADGFVVVSGEYNHSVPSALKNLLDHFQKEYNFKPAGIVTYSAGPFGGVRVSSHLRTILGELGMVTIPSMFPISSVQNSFTDDGTATDTAYERRIRRFFDELEWYLQALTTARKKGTPY